MGYQVELDGFGNIPIHLANVKEPPITVKVVKYLFNGEEDEF